MTEPSHINAKTPKTQRRHKGKAKAVSPNPATVVDPTPPAVHITPQGSGQAASSHHDHDDFIETEIESCDYGDFDYDVVKADDRVELWLVRAPSTLKARNLRDIEIRSSGVGLGGGLVGDLMRKGTAYDVWALDPAPSGGGGSASASASPSGDQDGFGGTTSSLSPSAAQVAGGVGAEELNGLSVLLPRKRKGGKLYLVQKPITRHLVVSARPARPTRPEVAYEAHKREAYPDEVLKHRFRPYGDPGDLPREDHMDVDVVEASPKEKKIKRKGSGETGSSKKRKTKLAAS